MPDCVFCKIVKKELPSSTFYEDEYSIAFLDIKQVSEGHSLVISKKHYENFFDVDPVVLQHIILSVQKVVQRLTKALGIAGMNISTNNGRPGQEVFHLHFHLIPRRAGDNLMMWPATSMSPEVLKIMAERIRKFF